MGSHRKHRSRVRTILYTVIGVMAANRTRQLYKKKQIKRFWRRGIFRDRKLHSEFYTMYQNLRDTDREYHFKYVRMSKERFDHLLGMIRHLITKKDTQMREAISAEERLVITLRFLSTGMSQQDLCFAFRVGRTTVCNIVREVCAAIFDILSPIYMRPPTTEDEWRHISNDFESLWDLPHCIGAIDGKHIRIDCPNKTGTNYHNYKGFFSMVLMAICDARYNFTLFDVGQFGSNNDSGILNDSEMGRAFDQGCFNYPHIYH